MRKYLFCFIFLINLGVLSTIANADTGWKQTLGSVKQDHFSVTIIEVEEALTSLAEAFASKLRDLKGVALEAERAETGISHHVIIINEGVALGIFRSWEVDHGIEAGLLLMDERNPFDLAPAVKVTLSVFGEKVSGYVQKFEATSAATSADHQSSLTYQIQKIGLLDLLLANGDRHEGNVVLKEGRFIPIDHNLSIFSLIKENRGLDVAAAVAKPPYMILPLPGLYNSPFWLVGNSFKQYAAAPWSPELCTLIEQWNPEVFSKELRARFGTSEATLNLLKVMSLWVKKGVSANLTLEQMGKPLYFAKGLQSFTIHSHFEDAWKIAGIEYDIQKAIVTTRKAIREGSSADAKSLFFENLEILFDRRIGFIKGSLSKEEVDAYYAEVWLAAFYRDHLPYKDLDASADEAQSCKCDANGSIPLPCVIEVIELSQQLLVLRLQREYGSVAAGMRDDFELVHWMFHNYVRILKEAVPGSDDYLRMAQYLRLEIEHFDEMMLPGVSWEPSVAAKLAHMSVSDVQTSIKLVKAWAQHEADFFNEKMGDKWIAFTGPKLISKAIKRVQYLRSELKEGRITQQEFDKDLTRRR
ncbi:MAG: hypothetical protein Q8K75_05430 [Chlamydiales bacterium]|nr:hypothetical protein [Chlamydiales bacterium]